MTAVLIPDLEVLRDLEEGMEEGMVDEGLEEGEDEEVEDGGLRTGRRGPDLAWQNLIEFETTELYQASNIPSILKSGFTLRSGKLSNNETYYCKYMRKKGYSCKVKMRVLNSESSEQVEMQLEGGVHDHELKNDEVEGNDYYNRWTEAQTKIVMTGVLNEASPTVIRRLLREEFPDGKMPSAIQLANKIAHCRKVVTASRNILMTGELKDFISQRLQVPESQTEMYVASHEVIDDQGEDNIRFSIIFTTPAMKRRLSTELMQDDATYRLTWQGFPVYISGRSTPTGKFFATHVTLQSHEDTRAYVNMFK